MRALLSSGPHLASAGMRWSGISMPFSRKQLASDWRMTASRGSPSALEAQPEGGDIDDEGGQESLEQVNAGEDIGNLRRSKAGLAECGPREREGEGQIPRQGHRQLVQLADSVGIHGQADLALPVFPGQGEEIGPARQRPEVRRYKGQAVVLHHLPVGALHRRPRLLPLHELDFLEARGMGVIGQEVRPRLPGQRPPGEPGLERRGDEQEERVAVQEEVQHEPHLPDGVVRRAAHPEHRAMVGDVQLLPDDGLRLAAEDLRLVEEVLGERVGLEEVPLKAQEARVLGERAENDVDHRESERGGDLLEALPDGRARVLLVDDHEPGGALALSRAHPVLGLRRLTLGHVPPPFPPAGRGFASVPLPSTERARVRGKLHYTKRQETLPNRVNEARAESPAFGRSTLEMEPVSTTSRALRLRPMRPRVLASHASELSGFPMTSAAVFVAAIWPFCSKTTPSSERSSPLTEESGRPSTIALV